MLPEPGRDTSGAVHTHDVAAALAPFRRRLFVGALVSNLPWATAVSVLSGVVVGTMVVPTTPWLTVFAWAVPIGAGIGLALAVARTPPVARTARIVDARLGLQNRATTALEFAHRDDTMSTLVVHDAVRHLASRRVGELRAVGSTARSGLAACVGAAGLALAIAIVNPHVSATGASMTAAASGGASATSTVDGASRRQARAGARPAAPGATTEHQESFEAVSAARSGEREPASAPANEVRGAATSQSAEGRAPGGPSPDSPDGKSTSLSTTPVAPSADRAPASAAATGADGAAVTPPGPAEARATRAASGRTASAGGTGDPVGDARAGGGVAGGSARPGESSSQPEFAPPIRLDSGTLNAASARAETAIARARVPRRLRGYVRDYFRALRGDTTP